jgi:hypothetical protein
MESAAPGAVPRPIGSGAMSDILMLAIGLGVFALLAFYGIAGERL